MPIHLNRLRELAGLPPEEPYKGPGFVTNIEQDTIENSDFRKVLYTANHVQLVLMSIEPSSDIGVETHTDLDQFIRVESGAGYVMMNGVKSSISAGFALIIPAGTEHNIVNTGDKPLKIYTVYAPPNHQKDVVHRTKADAEADEEHFDGDTDL